MLDVNTEDETCWRSVTAMIITDYSNNHFMLRLYNIAIKFILLTYVYALIGHISFVLNNNNNNINNNNNFIYVAPCKAAVTKCFTHKGIKKQTNNINHNVTLFCVTKSDLSEHSELCLEESLE